jgi:DNA-binding transcriptional MerR regulator
MAAKMSTETLLHAREFAARAGVTVRTLHHYDRLGILKPQRRTAKGYRLYGEREFARLQQIVTLKFIGFSLTQIRKILNESEPDLKMTLRMQRRLIEGQKRRLDAALSAIERAEKVLSENGAADWESFRKIIEVIDMEKNMEWAKQYYSDEARRKIEARAKNLTPEMMAKAQQDWATLIAEVETAISEGVSSKSERAQALAARWKELVRGFTGGDPEIQAGLNRLYADKANWPQSFKKPYSDEVGAFMREAMSCAANI